MPHLSRAIRHSVLGFILLAPLAAAAQDRPTEKPTLTIRRAQGPIVIDGDLGDEGWKGADAVTRWWETNPGDNVEPPVKNVGYVAYDDRFFYAAFEFHERDIRELRGPYGDHDAISSTTDYGGIIINPSNDRKTAILFLANPRGVQYDAVSNDATGEDNSPDFYWDTATRVLEDRWILEMRIPFSSLRYSDAKVQEWGIMFYRNWARDRRYQFFSTMLPRNVNCFICSSQTLTGLENLPAPGNFTVVPYATAAQTSAPEGALGTRLDSDDPEFDFGLDAKWTPNADNAIDVTVNPDFSQVESDQAVITANERFAIFFTEKRPFFLEGKDLFSTPINAVYTRAVTEPRWGLRGTGKLFGTTYTALVVDDEGGGSVIIPGVLGSQFAPQDFQSLNLISRFRRDYAKAFGSFLLSAREIDGGGHNRVFGPDFQWRPTPQQTITGQILLSQTETPNRPDLHPEWNGQSLDSHAGRFWYSFANGRYDTFWSYNDYGNEFRADLGFIPQVGWRGSYVDGGRTWRPKGFLTRIRVFTEVEYNEDQGGALIERIVNAGSGMDGRWASNGRFWVSTATFRSGTRLLDRNNFQWQLSASPSRKLTQIAFNGTVGEAIDFANSREGEGTTLSLSATLRPTDHLEIVLNNSLQQLEVDAGRLFTAQVERMKATYTFNARSFVRLIAQHVRTDRHPENYTFPVTERSADISASALYAYKLNWQTVLFVGYGDQQAFTLDTDNFEQAGRQLFLKVSYAFQR